jgi:2-keto-3-deoxy-L-rhamnonate aldolase RhmA
MKFIIIENNPLSASLYQQSGVERIMIDLEVLGKTERQGHLDAVLSYHSNNDVEAVKKVLSTSSLLVRINPWNSASAAEIEDVISKGAEIIMLPMARSLNEAEQFLKAVNKRTRTIFLLETLEAVKLTEKILSLKGFDEFYIGLNDLSIAMKNSFMFEALAEGLVDNLSALFNRAAVPFGFGGLGTAEGGAIAGEMVIKEHARLGSSMVILSRTFKKAAGNDLPNITAEVQKLRAIYNQALTRTQAEIAADKDLIHKRIKETARKNRPI